MDGIAEQKQKEVARERSIIAERIARLSSQLDNLSLWIGSQEVLTVSLQWRHYLLSPAEYVGLDRPLCFLAAIRC